MTAAQLAARDIPVVLVDGSGRARPRHRLFDARTGPSAQRRLGQDERLAGPTPPFRQLVRRRWQPGSFAERRAFGDYLGEQLAAARGDRGDRRDGDRCRAARARAGGSCSPRADGRRVGVVLAQGNQPPTPFPRFGRASAGLFVNNPWSEDAHGGGRAGCRRGPGRPDPRYRPDHGRHRPLSRCGGARGPDRRRCRRRGLIPRAHVDPPAAPAPVSLDEVPLGNVLSLWRWLRRRAAHSRFSRRGRCASSAQPRHLAKPRRARAAPLHAPCAAMVGRSSPPHRPASRRAAARADRRRTAGDRRRPGRVGWKRSTAELGWRSLAATAATRFARSGSPSIVPVRWATSGAPPTRCSAASSTRARFAPMSSPWDLPSTTAAAPAISYGRSAR